MNCSITCRERRFTYKFLARFNRSLFYLSNLFNDPSVKCKYTVISLDASPSMVLLRAKIELTKTDKH